MAKVTFIGAGSTVFTKNLVGDMLLTPALSETEIALYDIDSERLADSKIICDGINNTNNNGRAKIVAYDNRIDALKNADYVIVCIQVGGYKPATVTDFEIPKKYGLRQTIGDTLGIGGIFRALRTIPVLLSVAQDMEKVCPDAIMLNYANPMAMNMGGIFHGSGIKAIGLCHSVQVCASSLLGTLNLEYPDVSFKIAGINHMAWLLELKSAGRDIYPEVRRYAAENSLPEDCKNKVRIEIMKKFGYYITESSEHLSEYLPYFIKSTHPELIDKFNIPLDEYLRRCVNQIENWANLRKKMLTNTNEPHKKTHEYGSAIINAIETNETFKFGGNVLNNGLITNLPADAVVEVPCIADALGITPCKIGDLPPQLAALNRTNINPQLLAVEAALTLKKEYIYHAAMLDPHTSAELTMDEIIAMCDDLIKAHEGFLPQYK